MVLTSLRGLISQLGGDRAPLELGARGERKRPVRDLQRHLAAQPHEAAHRKALHELVLVEHEALLRSLECPAAQAAASDLRLEPWPPPATEIELVKRVAHRQPRNVDGLQPAGRAGY